MNLAEFLPMVAMGISLIIAIVGHEVMHGKVAYKYGDDTAKNQGRLSLNPLIHIDPIGTIVVPLALYFSTGFVFGWAKPVPVFMRTVIRNGGWGAAIHVSLAGIAYNFILALVAAAILSSLDTPSGYFGVFIYAFLQYLVIINVILGIFNLYPIPPLDGSHAISYAATWAGYPKIMHIMDKWGRYGFVILVVIIISPLSNYVFAPMRSIIQLLLG